MQSLPLTDKHKSKLLEMCEFFFPKYREDTKTHYGGIHFHHHDGTKGLPFIRDSEYLWGSTPDDGDLFDNASFAIHWFEFCMVHLSKKLFKTKEKYKGKGDTNSKEYIGTLYCAKAARSSFISSFVYLKKHPIDYLYKEFKSIKKLK